MRTCAAFLLTVLFLTPVRADSPTGKVVDDLWEVAHLEGARVGYFRTTVREVAEGEEKLYRTTQQMELTLKRFNAIVKVRAETGSEETPGGRVTAVSMRLPQDRGELLLKGTVTREGLHVKVDGGRIDKVIPWNDQVIGLYRQERLFQEQKVKSGDAFSFLSYEPTINHVVTIQVKVGVSEEVDTPKGKRSLLRVEGKPNKVEVPGASVQLPGMVVWLDEKRAVVRRQIELPGMGMILTHRTTREVALAEGGAVASLPDVGERTYIGLNRAITNPHATRSVVYRVTMKEDDDPTSALAQDARQVHKNVKGQSFEVHVRAVRTPTEVENPSQEAREEYRKSCSYIDSDDPKIRGMAKEIVGPERDPLAKARRIERWMHGAMRLDNTVSFCKASEVAQRRAGDCRQHAMLTTALCRASGVPSRTAIGLVPMIDPRGRPAMAYHMWSEVWVKGQWLALDSTLGQGAIGAAHLKIADHSWYEVESLQPLLAVQRVLGKMAIEVLNVDGRP